MELDHLIAFNLALLVALASPGPALLYALRTTLSSGRSAGIMTGCGLAFMAAGWTAMALLGLDGLFRLFPWAYMTIKVLGAAYLIYVAWSTWRSAYDSIGKVASNGAGSRRRAFLRGLLVNLANPKSVLFSAAVLVVIFPPELSLAQKAMIVGNHFLIEMIAYTAFALLLSTEPVSRAYLRMKPLFDRAAALVLGGLGLRLMFDQGRS